MSLIPLHCIHVTNDVTSTILMHLLSMIATRQFRLNTRVFFEFINHVLLNYRRKYFVDDIVKKKLT